VEGEGDEGADGRARSTFANSMSDELEHPCGNVDTERNLNSIEAVSGVKICGDHPERHQEARSKELHSNQRNAHRTVRSDRTPAIGSRIM
jgi:hypothetical protein